MRNRAFQRQSFHPLCSPVSADGCTPHPPYLLCVIAEEGRVEARAKPVDEERIQVHLVLLRKDLRPDVAQTDPERVPPAESSCNTERDRDRVGEEASPLIDARQAGPLQHHLVLTLR